MKKLFILILFLFACSISRAQNASPLGGVGSLQFFDNQGVPLTSGVVYIYQGGTNVPMTVYTDATGTTIQPNPVAFGAGARASIWLANSTLVKVVLCTQNDGAFCAAGDILFSADQVPIGSSSSGGGGGGSPFTGIFISSTPTPATSGALRLASGDSICWRNAAGSTNLCISKNSNDILQWSGGSVQLTEIAAPTCGGTGFDCFWADSGAHRWQMKSNGGTSQQVVGSGVDVNTSDQVIQFHFGAQATPLTATPLTIGQFLKWNGTNIVGSTIVAASVDLTAQAANIGTTAILTPAANGFFRFSCYVIVTQAATSSSTLPACQVVYTDADTAHSETQAVTAINTANVVGAAGVSINSSGVIMNAPASFYAQSGAAISYLTLGYLSSGATPMQYSIHLRLEGPF